MKLLNMHERVACRLPCLIEGETGVSKTALTKMYAILRNSSLKSEAVVSTEQAILAIERDLENQGFTGSGETSVLRLHDVLARASQKSIGDETEVAGALHKILHEKQRSRPNMFRSIPEEFNLDSESRTKSVRAFLNWFAEALLEPTFFDINVDASLTELDIVGKFSEIQEAARKLLGTGALVVVFLDGEYFLVMFYSFEVSSHCNCNSPRALCCTNRNQHNVSDGSFQGDRCGSQSYGGIA
jgi:hypothetical protein